MPWLDNTKHEVFCAAFIKCGQPRRAALIAGYSSKSASSQAYRLRQRDDINNRIKELEQMTAGQQDNLRQKAVYALALFAFGGLHKIFTSTVDGKPAIDLSTITPEDFTGIDLSVKVQRTRDGTILTNMRAKMSGKLEALNKLLPMCKAEAEFRGQKRNQNDQRGADHGK